MATFTVNLSLSERPCQFRGWCFPKLGLERRLYTAKQFRHGKSCQHGFFIFSLFLTWLVASRLTLGLSSRALKRRDWLTASSTGKIQNWLLELLLSGMVHGMLSILLIRSCMHWLLLLLLNRKVLVHGLC